MSITNTFSLEAIPANKLKDYVGKIVFRTFRSLNAAADDFPVGGRKDDDYDFVEQHIKIMAVQDDVYESLAVNSVNYLVSSGQKIDNYKFFIPIEEGVNSFLEDLRSIKKNAQTEHDAKIKFLDEALVIA